MKKTKYDYVRQNQFLADQVEPVPPGITNQAKLVGRVRHADNDCVVLQTAGPSCHTIEIKIKNYLGFSMWAKHRLGKTIEVIGQITSDGILVFQARNLKNRANRMMVKNEIQIISIITKVEDVDKDFVQLTTNVDGCEVVFHAQVSKKHASIQPGMMVECQGIIYCGTKTGSQFIVQPYFIYIHFMKNKGVFTYRREFSVW